MLSIYELVTLEFQNEHDLEHDLEHKTKFSSPKIFDGDGDLSKRWYVYFSYRDPNTGKLKRMKNIYGKVNRYKTKEERYGILNVYKKRLHKLLREGYDPFEDNTEFHKGKTGKDSKDAPKKQTQQNKPSEGARPDKNKTRKPNQSATRKTKTIEAAFDMGLKLKTNIVSANSIRDYKSRINKFIDWLKKNKEGIVNIDEVTKTMVREFLNEEQLKNSARNRNNYRIVLSSMFQIFADNEIVKNNFFNQIPVLKTKPKRNKTYTLKELDKIFEHLEKEDPILLLYIKFIGYNLLRPIEVNRLRVKDINLEQKTLQFQAKNKPLKTKIIPDILLKELPDLSKMKGESLLFTPERIGGEWETELSNRRDYFSKRFKKKVKEPMGFGTDYGLYSIRHTFITKMYRKISKNSSPYETKSKLMQITGHNTMEALEKYLRDIDAELPSDYSNLL